MANTASIAVGALGTAAVGLAYFKPSVSKALETVAGATGTATGAQAGGLGGSLAEIRAQALSKIGIARATRGSMMIPPPGGFPTSMSEVARLMSFYITEFNIPGKQIQTVDVRRYGVGTTTKYPVSVVTEDINVNLIVDGQGVIVKFFYNWLNMISNSYTIENSMSVQAYKANLYDVAYRKSGESSIYTTDATMFVKSDSTDSVLSKGPGADVLAYNLFEMYPTAIGDMQMNWANVNGLATVPVRFTYKYYSIEDATMDQTKPQELSTTTPSLNGLQSVIKAATVAQVVTATKKPRNVGDILNVVNNTAMVASILTKF